MHATPKQALSPLKGAQAERIPSNLLLEPIEYLYADHCRQMDMCRALQDLAQARDPLRKDPQIVAMIVYCLDNDLPMHIMDEEQDLFPHLRLRMLTDDGFEEILRLLDSEHDRDRVLVREVRGGLEKLSQGVPPEDLHAFRTAAQVLAQAHLSHLRWENAVVLTLARKRLTEDDQKVMGQAMAKRRNIPYPGT